MAMDITLILRTLSPVVEAMEQLASLFRIISEDRLPVRSTGNFGRRRTWISWQT